MKKLLIGMSVVLAATCFSSIALAAIKCVPSGGGTCCWDTEKDGPFKPIGC